MERERQILACSGMLYPPEGAPPEVVGAQVRQAMALSGAQRPKVCLVPTATGDAQAGLDRWYESSEWFGPADLSHLVLFAQLLAQDVIYVSGGSVVNLLAVWRAHRLDVILRECWAAGVVLAGGSAGSLCWHLSGVTDSFSDSLDLVTNGLGFLPFSNGVHDDLADQPRRQRFRELIAAGELPAGYATEDGTGLHYVGTELREALGIVPGRHAWHVAPDGAGGYQETAIPARYWLPDRRWP